LAGCSGGNDDGVVNEYSERENKYDAAAGYVLPDMQDLVPDGGRVERGTVRLDSVYFDTEQHDLIAHGVTLRCRTGQADAGWQLKVPAGDARTRRHGGPFLRANLTTPPTPRGPEELPEKPDQSVNWPCRRPAELINKIIYQPQDQLPGMTAHPG